LAPAALAGTLSAAGGIAKVAGDGAAALNLFGADEVRCLDDTRPGLDEGLFSQFGTGHGGADRPAGGGLLHVVQRLDALDIDNQIGLDKSALHADEKIGPAGQHISASLGLGEQGHGGLCRLRCFVLHFCHLLLSCTVVWSKVVRSTGGRTLLTCR
jgi:hypothetical protein